MTYLYPLSDADFTFDIALGLATGYSVIHKFGRNAAVGTTLEDVWTQSGAYAYQSSAQALEIVSGSGNDDSGGTGALTVTIQGLDGSYDEQEETVTMDGATPVALSNTYIRVHRAFVATAGSGGENAGLLTIRLSGAGATQAEIVAGRNQTEMTQYTVPNAKSGLLIDFWGSLTGGPGASVGIDFTIFQRPTGGTFRELLYREVWLAGQSNFQHVLPIPVAFTAKTDLVVRAAATSGSEECSAGYTLVLKDD